MKCSVSAALGTNPDKEHNSPKKHLQLLDIGSMLENSEQPGALTQVIRKFAKEEKVGKITLQVEYDEK